MNRVFFRFNQPPSFWEDEPLLWIQLMMAASLRIVPRACFGIRLDFFVSSLRRSHANLLCVVPRACLLWYIAGAMLIFSVAFQGHACFGTCHPCAGAMLASATTALKTFSRNRNGLETPRQFRNTCGWTPLFMTLKLFSDVKAHCMRDTISARRSLQVTPSSTHQFTNPPPPGGEGRGKHWWIDELMTWWSVEV